MLHPPELPGNLDVRPANVAVGDLAIPMPFRPAVTGLEIELPIDRGVGWIDERPDPAGLRNIWRVDALAKPAAVRIRIDCDAGGKPDPFEAGDLHPVADRHPARSQQVELVPHVSVDHPNQR